MCESAAAWAGPCTPPLIATVSAPAPAARRRPRRVKSIVCSDDNGRGAVRSHIVILLPESLPSESNVRATLRNGAKTGTCGRCNAVRAHLPVYWAEQGGGTVSGHGPVPGPFARGPPRQTRPDSCQEVGTRCRRSEERRVGKECR